MNIFSEKKEEEINEEEGGREGDVAQWGGVGRGGLGLPGDDDKDEQAEDIRNSEIVDACDEDK